MYGRCQSDPGNGVTREIHEEKNTVHFPPTFPVTANGMSKLPPTRDLTDLMYPAWRAFNTGTHIAGPMAGNAWVSQPGQITNQRLLLRMVETASVTVTHVGIVNMHDSGTWAERGVRNVRMYVTTQHPGRIFGDNVTASQCIFEGQVPMYSPSVKGYTRLPLASNNISGAFFVVDAIDTWGGLTVPWMGIRKIALVTL